MPKEGNKGMNSLANVLGQMISEKSEQPLVLDFGIVNGDMSLTTNTYPCPIPATDYSICRTLTYDPSVPLTETYSDGAHDHPGAGYGGAHVNKVKLPEKMYGLKAGDKVLVAWVQNEAVVIDVVYDGTKRW